MNGTISAEYKNEMLNICIVFDLKNSAKMQIIRINAAFREI